MERGVRPWLQPDWIFYLTSRGRETRRCVKTLHQFTNKVQFMSINIIKYSELHLF